DEEIAPGHLADRVDQLANVGLTVVRRDLRLLSAGRRPGEREREREREREQSRRRAERAADRARSPPRRRLVSHSAHSRFSCRLWTWVMSTTNTCGTPSRNTVTFAIVLSPSASKAASPRLASFSVVPLMSVTTSPG